MINLTMPTVDEELKPRITVFGVGGAGGNAINNMIKSNLEGVDFVVGNTDAQALAGSLAEKRLQLGTTITKGLGAGSRPDLGRAAAEEQIDEIISYLDGANMVFITAGMGGGTGTGAAPVIARVARDKGILTVGVVTKPFHFEGVHRMRLAEQGIAELQDYVDTLIVIPNQNLFRIANDKTTFADAFKMADDVLYSGVRGVTDLMVMPGLINLDFADIRSVMSEMGKAMMGTGEATGERRSVEAAEAAISNPLLDDVSMQGARGVLINITGGYDMTLFEVDEAANRIRDDVDPEANIIFGSTFDETMEGRMRVSVVATGIDSPVAKPERPALTVVSDRSKGRADAREEPKGVVAATASAAASPATRTPADYATQLKPAQAQPQAAASQRAGATGQGGGPVGAAAKEVAENTAGLNTPPAGLQVATPSAASVVSRTASPLSATGAGSDRATGDAGGSTGTGGNGGTASRPNRLADVFIPPKPVSGGTREASLSAGPLSGGQGHAEADRLGGTALSRPGVPIGDNGAAGRRARSLFERVTGLANGKGRERSDEDEDADRGSATGATAGGVLTAQRTAQIERPQSQKSSGLSAPERPSLSAGDDDLFDIPAFLRRQGN